MKYEISYTSDAITLKNKIFINDKEFVCPDVILPVPKDTNTSIATKVPPCNEVLYGLSEAEKEGVRCTGNYSLSIEKTIP